MEAGLVDKRFSKGYEIISVATKHLLGQSFKCQKVERDRGLCVVQAHSRHSQRLNLLSSRVTKCWVAATSPRKGCSCDFIGVIITFLPLPPPRAHFCSYRGRKQNLKSSSLIKLNSRFPSCWFSSKERSNPAWLLYWLNHREENAWHTRDSTFPEW